VIEEGKPAPDFELQTDGGDTVKLSDLRGRPVVLYFYPKDDTKATQCSSSAPRPAVTNHPGVPRSAGVCRSLQCVRSGALAP
jgi:peroxiredoxin